MARLDDLVGAQALASPGSPDALSLAAEVARRGGPSVRGVLFFGSRRSGAATDPHSGFDFFVLVEAHRPFYDALARDGSMARSPALVSALNGPLPPNQIRLKSDGRVAKCAVVRLERFERETSARRSDHFCIGRLFQPSSLAFASDDEARRRILACLASAHRETMSWVRPWLPTEFGVEGYCRKALEVSMSFEIRPEPAGRAEKLWAAQKERLLTVYPALLDELAQSGELRELGGGRFALARPVSESEQLRTRLYFEVSRLRATLRWAKYVVTFEDWLDYIVKKAERHSGESIQLSEREKSWPLLFLWPRAARFLLSRDRKTRRGR